MSNTRTLKKQFLNALKRGTGEAYLLVRDNPEIDFSNQIIKGVLNIYAYDGQCEGNRAHYIFDIISISTQQEKIRTAVLKGLAVEQNETWNLTHLFALTKLYALQNDTEAKQAIYDRFLNNPIENSDWVGYSEILELDGFEGLLFVAEKFGNYIEQNPDDWQDDWIINDFQKMNPNIAVNEELEKAATTNKYIRLYLDNINRTKESWNNNKAETTTYFNIIDEVLNSKPFISFRRIRNLSSREVTQVGKRLRTETDSSNIEKLLDIFGYHKFPFDSNLILNFAKQKQTSHNRIVENAVDALTHLKSKSIRAFALDKILNAKKSIDYLKILVSNYQKGDFKLLNTIAVNTNNADKIEQLAIAYIAIYKANKTKECKEPLETLYAKMNCGVHRNSIVEILFENNVLSDKIKQEIKFDSDLDTRKLADKMSVS